MLQHIRDIISTKRLNFISNRRKIKLGKQIDKTKVNHLKKTVDCLHKWYGSSYGGFYINPANLNAESVIYSFGIGKDITFDLKCIANHNCQVFAFDPTPKSINWVKSKKLPKSFTFFGYGISASESSVVDFYLPANPKGTSGSLLKTSDVNAEKSIRVEMKSFSDITKELGHKHIDVLKMDIEGAEYEVLESILESSVSIGQILVEFHDRLFDMENYKSKEIVKKMNEKGFEIFAHSISYEEVSFLAVTKISKNLTQV